MNYSVRQLMHTEYPAARDLDANAFGHNERGSNAAEHAAFADSIRRSPFYIPALDLAAVDENGLLLGHGIFSALPMGDNHEHVIWLNSLAVRYDPQDSHTDGVYRYQRKGIGRAIVRYGLAIATQLGYTGCMTCGDPRVYQEKMGFSNYRDLGISKDESVDDPDPCIFAMEISPDGFAATNKTLSYTYYNFFADL